MSKAAALKRLMSPGTQMPVYLLMFITNRCNAKCAHCFYWRELNSKIKLELSLQEYEKLARSLGPMLQITLTGGSPELRKVMPEIAQIFYEHCRPEYMTFCMLGHATDRILDHVDRVMKLCPGQNLTAAISIDGIKEEHDELRGLAGSFDNAVKTIQGLSLLKKKYRTLRTAVGITVHGKNFKTAERTALWARENLPIDQLKPILVRGDPYDRSTLDRVCVNTYLNVIDKDRQWVNGSRLERFSSMDYVINAKEQVQRRLISEISNNGTKPVTCSGGRETAVIRPTGDVLGCELREDKILGNLRDVDVDFRRIWFGEHANHFRKTVGHVKECEGCYHHCFISPAVFRTPKLWPELAQAAFSIWKSSGHRRQSITA